MKAMVEDIPEILLGVRKLKGPLMGRGLLEDKTNTPS